MKRMLMIAAVVCAGVFGVAGATGPTRAAAKSMTLAERKAQAQRIMLERTGGFMIRPGTQHGKIVYLNGQKRVDAQVVDKQLAVLRELLRVKIELVPGDGKFSISDMLAAKKRLGANAVVFFADDAALAETMLVAPESGWAVVNFAALAKDNPDRMKLEKRTIRETWRVFAHLLGGANTKQSKCVLRPVFAPGDLDDLFGEAFCPEPLDKIVENLKAMGVDPAVRTTYRQACEDGWAPAPTNAIQKAIWDKVHQLPDAPLVIKPETKKVVDK